MMLRPSYNDLINSANKYSGHPETPTVQSRYSIVIATAKRARQLINGEEAAVPSYGKKPLSVAIEELYKGKVKIVNEDEEEIPAAQDEETLTTE